MYRSHIHRLSFSLLALLLASAQLTVCDMVGQVQAEDYYHKDFGWSYAGFDWTWSLDIPKSLYTTYQSVSVSQRVRNGVEGYGFLVTTRDSYVVNLANALHESATSKGYDAYDEVSFILAFVQSLPYTSDSATTGYDEYPRFSVETLVDGGGDCEDTSILFATIALILNYDAIFISPPNHVAVGISGRDLGGSYYAYNDKTYYYCETTGDGWKIGDIPEIYRDVSAHLYTINENIQYSFDWLTPAISSVIIVVVAVGVLALLLYAAIKKRSRQTEPTRSPPMPPFSSSYCLHCGSENKNDAIFCERCGEKLSKF